MFLVFVSFMLRSRPHEVAPVRFSHLLATVGSSSLSIFCSTNLSLSIRGYKMMARLISAQKCVLTAATVTRKLFGALTVAVLVLGLATSAQAQTQSGSIKGTVEGSSSMVTVQVVDEARGHTKTESPAADGSFKFDGLAPGNYTVNVLMGDQMVDTVGVNVEIGALKSSQRALNHLPQ